MCGVVLRDPPERERTVMKGDCLATITQEYYGRPVWQKAFHSQQENGTESGPHLSRPETLSSLNQLDIGRP